MRGKACWAVLAIVLGPVPIAAQVRQPVVREAGRPASPRLLPNRTIDYIRPAPAQPRVVVVPAARRPSNSAQAGDRLEPSAASLEPIIASAPSVLGELLNPAPGLGFDFTHLAAINSDLAVRAIIDPLTRQELALAERLPREQSLGFLPWLPDYGYAAAPAAALSQPQVIVIQETAPQPAPAPQAVPPPAASTPPLPGVGEFLLVLRDGTVIATVAFSRVDDRIVYITSAGLRRTIPIDRVDLKATDQRNADRGSILRLTD